MNTAGRPAPERAAEEYTAEYAASLAAVLRGPAGAKARLVEEIRDGFADTLAAYRAAGASPEHAVRQAVREFGGADDLAPSCQRELTLVQTRRTAGTLALAAPLLLGGWHLAWVDGPTHGAARAALFAAVLLAGLTAAGAVVAVSALLVTGPLARRLSVPERLPLVTAWTASTVGAAMIAATLTLAVASASTTGWPVIAVAVVLTLAAHVTVAASARACRECASPPPSSAHTARL